MLRLVQTRHSTYFAASTPARTILTGTGAARRICNNVLSIKQNRTIHKSLIPESILFLIFATLLPSTLSAVRRDCKKEPAKAGSLNERKSLSKNGVPVAFLIKKTYNDYHLLVFVYGIKRKIIVYHNKSNSPPSQHGIIHQL